jgi:hypothetical protein
VELFREDELRVDELLEVVVHGREGDVELLADLALRRVLAREVLEDADRGRIAEHARELLRLLLVERDEHEWFSWHEGARMRGDI